MKFTIANTTVRAGDPPARVIQMCSLLDALPDGELLTYHEAGTRLKRERTWLMATKGHILLADYWTLALVRGTYRVLFGNPATIAAYNEEFGT